jgi:SAM-dependent methyltransferase
MLAQSPFDVLAETYDTDFTQSQIGRLQRNRVWKYVNALLQNIDKPLKILEVNCGTGEDALKLAAMGHTVMATDASNAMIEKAQQKSVTLNISSRQIEFIQCRFDELKQKFQNEEFDLVFSNFGGINCIDRSAIKKLSNDLTSIVNINGFLFFTVMSSCCLWEMFYYMLKEKWSTAFRRRKRSVDFNVNGSAMQVFYYSPHNFKKLFQLNFKPVETYPVGLFIPPSYLEQQFLKRKNWLRRLNHYEEKLGNYSMFSSLADHYCMILKRNKA